MPGRAHLSDAGGRYVKRLCSLGRRHRRGIGELHACGNGNHPSALSRFMAHGAPGKGIAMQQRIERARPQPIDGHGNRLLTGLALGTAIHIKGNGEVATLIRNDLKLPDE